MGAAHMIFRAHHDCWRCPLRRGCYDAKGLGWVQRVKDQENFTASRRDFLKTISWASACLLPTRFFAAPLKLGPGGRVYRDTPLPARPGFRLSPHYPEKSPLDEVFRQADPGNDEFVLEKYASEITNLLNQWSAALKSNAGRAALAGLIDSKIEATPLASAQETFIRSGTPIEVFQRRFQTDYAKGAEPFLQEMEIHISRAGRVETAEFHVIAIEATPSAASVFNVDIRYDLVGIKSDIMREGCIGKWRTRWLRDETQGWRVVRWEAVEETVSRVRGPAFLDVTSQAFGKIQSYRDQMGYGADHWRTVLDAACGIDVYGNDGLAAGDFDNDGFDDLYICQPPGLPNRLYRNCGNGTFEDVTEQAGVGVLDGTACALFADFQNRGLQDLLVVCANGPMLFVNEGKGKFQLKRDAFKFALPPQGTFTHAAVADYDGDGRLDVYFCLYSYYLGLDQYHYPAPYFDARNGPPNFLFHNEGDGGFADRTQAAGLNAENDRYSFACAWGDCNSNGHPDLYVANDFGRNNLYRNNGNGTFTAVSADAHAQDVGAGMSACWFDYDNDGNADVYVSNMWSAAGLRVSQQKPFHKNDAEEILVLYRQHARGNSLYRNLGNGKFENVSDQAGVAMGRWAWSSDAWDFDHDGYADLYIANGYISGPNTRDLASFFWRQVVGQSPSNASPSPGYEHGWNAINELIRSDDSWSGHERNVCYLNNHDGTFSEVSGVLALDFPDDSRTFALADLDHDGRLEIVLKNRNAPQLRVLRNALQNIGSSVAFRLRGQKSNRDAIGASITVEAAGLRQKKYVQAGSGFLAQHSKELFFGLGKSGSSLRATIRWPSGLTQAFEQIPANHRIEIEEGSANFQATPFAASPPSYARADTPQGIPQLPPSVETWLIEPLSAPEFSLPDLQGNTRSLRSFRGSVVLLCFWATDPALNRHQFEGFKQRWSQLTANRLQVLGINVDDPVNPVAVQALVAREELPFPTLLATSEVAGIYNIIYRYLFDRRRDLPVPCSFLLDEDGRIVKVYQGNLSAEGLVNDLSSLPKTREERIAKALPFPGLVPQGGFPRNDFTYGVALFQRGYFDQAAESFKQVIAAKPQNSEAYYNLGTLYLRRDDLSDAASYLQRAVELNPNYPEAWNNLGMVAARQGRASDATRNFERSLELRPGYTVALLNLGNLYRREGAYDEAETVLRQALELEPENPEVNYSLGMVCAQQNQIPRALEYLASAVKQRPDYAEALNNLGVLLVREQRYADAEEQLKTCIRVAPNFDQGYLNLARLYVVLHQEAKAREVLQALLRIQPQHKMAQQTLEMLH